MEREREEKRFRGKRVKLSERRERVVLQAEVGWRAVNEGLEF